MSDFPYGLDEVGWDRYCEARDEKANDEEEDEMTEPNEAPAETGRLYVVLAEQLPYDSVRAVWETVLRAVFVSRDAALEAGRERLEREPVEEGGAVPRRLVAVPQSYFQPRIAEVERTERLVWRDASEAHESEA